MHTVTILAGRNKTGQPEGFERLTLQTGELYTIVGETGAGKSRLIKDLEQLADGDSVTGRCILLNHAPVPRRERQTRSAGLMAHLGQNMRFTLDTTVADFLNLHATCRGKENRTAEVLELTNRITAEPVAPEQNLNLLSGGQSRALMIADIARICDSPIVLIDEIENAGIDKERALSLLCKEEKLVLVVTHDPHTALLSPRRIVMKNGAIQSIVERTPAEEALFQTMSQEYQLQRKRQQLLRKGDFLA